MDEQRELQDEYEAQYGDPRRCPAHGCVTSSPDGLFDAPCPECEGEMQDAAYDETLDNEFASWEAGISVSPESYDDEPF